MITKASVLLTVNASDEALNDKRALVLIELLQSRMSIEDIATALNCSEQLVRSLLVQPYRSLYAGTVSNPLAITVPINLVNFPQRQRTVISGALPETPDEFVRRRQRLAQHLAKEVQPWLCSFEASDQDRREAIQRARSLLAESASYWKGEYVYEVERVSMQIAGMWRPWLLSPVDREFRELAGRWLAAWIRFWIVDPEIWKLALDQEIGHFAAKELVAA